MVPLLDECESTLAVLSVSTPSVLEAPYFLFMSEPIGLDFLPARNLGVPNVEGVSERETCHEESSGPRDLTPVSRDFNWSPTQETGEAQPILSSLVPVSGSPMTGLEVPTALFVDCGVVTPPHVMHCIPQTLFCSLTRRRVNGRIRRPTCRSCPGFVPAPIDLSPGLWGWVPGRGLLVEPFFLG